jgi:hypothetical protein
MFLNIPKRSQKIEVKRCIGEKVMRVLEVVELGECLVT